MPSSSRTEFRFDAISGVSDRLRSARGSLQSPYQSPDRRFSPTRFIRRDRRCDKHSHRGAADKRYSLCQRIVGLRYANPTYDLSRYFPSAD